MVSRNSAIFVVVGLLTFTGSKQLAAADRCEFEISVNAVRLHYDLSPLLPFRGKCNPFVSGSLHLSPGRFTIPFFTTIDRPLSLFFEDVGPVAFTAGIRALNKPRLAVEELPKHAGPGGDAEHLFFPENKPTEIAFRTTNSRRWLIRTKFEDREKKIPLSRLYCTLEGGLLISFNTMFREAASKKPEWRNKRLELQEELARRLTINPRK